MDGFREKYGILWPEKMHDVMVGLMLGKKWREFRARGDTITVEPWVPYLESMRTVYGDKFRVSEWAEAHVRHWVMHENPIYWGSASCGKMLLKSEPVFTESGRTTIGELEVGDSIMSVTGKPAVVTGVYDQIDRPLYRIRFSDGTSTVCGDEHLWEVRYWGRKRWIGPRNARKAENGFVSRIRTTEYLYGLGDKSLHRRRMSIPTVSPVEFSSSPVPVDPYVLGCLIGDGSFTKCTVSLTSHPDDIELREEFRKRLDRCAPGHILSPVKGHDGTSYTITHGLKKGSSNIVRDALRNLGLFGHRAEEKFIPTEYLFNSVDVRLDLLAGLMDTDGTIDKTGRISFCTTSKRLSEDVRFIFESLGGYVTIAEKHPTFVYRGERRRGRTAYEVIPRGLPEDLVRRMFKLGRKLSRVKKRRTLVGHKSITSVEKIENRSDFPRETRCITIAEKDVCGNPTRGLFPVGNFTVTHNSNNVGACVVADWITDPYDTITVIGSTTRPMLQIRVWEAVLRYLGAFKAWGDANGFLIPGQVAAAGYSIVNDKSSGNVEDQAVKAGIHGVALDEGGKLQGAHMPYVRVVIDELATLKVDMNEIVTALTNLQVAKDFKFAAMANPDPWTDPSSSIFCTPVGGIDSVSVESREWETTFGAHVLHDDGLKSPCVLHPELAGEFPFLTQKKHLDKALKMSGGNTDAPSFWKMARGFPTPAGSEVPPVLDPAIASRNAVTEPGVFDVGRWRGTAAGIDPAWTEGGDGACRARCYIMVDGNGRTYLDFTGGLRRLHIEASRIREHPALEQMMDQVLDIMRSPYEASFANTAVDSSGNQGLGSTLKMFAGAYDILEVSNSDRASKNPVIKFDMRPADDMLADRGTEAWVVLARFCEAGMVKGLPEEAKRALTMRRYAVDRDKVTGIVSKKKGKDRLEAKKDFKPRFGHSPDEADACALAALAVKERFGILPFGFLDRPVSPIASPAGEASKPVALPAFVDRSDGDSRAEDCGDAGFDPFA